MNLGTPAKLLLLALTLLPLAYLAFFFASFALTFSSSSHDQFLFSHFKFFMLVHLGAMLLIFGLVAFYLVFLFKTQRVKNDLKALWAIVLFMGGPVGMLVFWYVNIWRDPAPPAAA